MVFLTLTKPKSQTLRLPSNDLKIFKDFKFFIHGLLDLVLHKVCKMIVYQKIFERVQFLFYFRPFLTEEIVDFFTEIRTPIVIVEDEHADHKTTLTLDQCSLTEIPLTSGCPC